MANAVTVAPGSGFTGATAVLNSAATDKAGFVTFTTSTTIPGSGPYLLCTLTFSGSWADTYSIPPVVIAYPSANPFNSRTASQEAAAAALGPFFVILNSNLTQAAVYCTSAPSESTAYDIGYAAIQGP